jgi:hypothetical protein
MPFSDSCGDFHGFPQVRKKSQVSDDDLAYSSDDRAVTVRHSVHCWRRRIDWARDGLLHRFGPPRSEATTVSPLDGRAAFRSFAGLGKPPRPAASADLVTHTCDLESASSTLFLTIHMCRLTNSAHACADSTPSLLRTNFLIRAYGLGCAFSQASKTQLSPESRRWRRLIWTRLPVPSRMHLMNLTCDFETYYAWLSAVCVGCGRCVHATRAPAGACVLACVFTGGALRQPRRRGAVWTQLAIRHMLRAVRSSQSYYVPPRVLCSSTVPICETSNPG